MKKSLILLLLIVSIFLTGCTNKDKDNILNVLNWSSYIPSEIVNEFEDETGIRVNYNTYSSNEELLAKLSSSKSGTYDLIFPSDYMIDLMMQKDMLEKIDVSKISNIDNINEMFMHQPYDYFNDYSLPFLAATTVIAYNTDNIKEDITSYRDLMSSLYKNDIVLIDDQRIMVGMALLANRYDMNSVDKEELTEARDWFLRLKGNVKAFDSDSPKTFLITNETNIGVIWNAEALIAQEENPNIKIVYPMEGHALSIDNYAIVKGAKHQDNAYKFIDYLLRSDVSKKITDEYPYINTTNGARNVSFEELNEVFESGKYVNNIGESIALYDKVWAEIK